MPIFFSSSLVGFFFFYIVVKKHMGSVGKEPAYNVGDTGDTGSIPGSGISPGGEHSNPLQYSRLENPMDRGAWRATIHGFTRVVHDRSNSIHAHGIHSSLPGING